MLQVNPQINKIKTATAQGPPPPNNLVLVVGPNMRFWKNRSFYVLGIGCNVLPRERRCKCVEIFEPQVHFRKHLVVAFRHRGRHDGGPGWNLCDEVVQKFAHAVCPTVVKDEVRFNWVVVDDSMFMMRNKNGGEIKKISNRTRGTRGKWELTVEMSRWNGQGRTTSSVLFSTRTKTLIVTPLIAKSQQYEVYFGK